MSVPLVQPVGVPLTEEDARRTALGIVQKHVGPVGWVRLTDAIAQALLSVDVASREQAQKEAREVIYDLLASLRPLTEQCQRADKTWGDDNCHWCRTGADAIKAAESYLA